MLEGKSHFFTNPASISQTEAQAFGPVFENETNDYRITSKFTLSKNEDAFAICTGMVLIVSQTDNANLVNLILKPFTQPLKGVNVKYFIYRGLLKEDFFTNDGKIISTTANTSYFINKINNTFYKFHEDENPMPVFEAKYIGYNSNLLNNVLLDDLFFKVTLYQEINNVMVEVENTAYDLPLIEMGKTLGRFTSGECAVDMILDYGDYKTPNNIHEFQFNLGYARAADAIISITGITDNYIKKLRKEQITQFVDIVAYYGAHHAGNCAVICDKKGIKEEKILDAIYTELLTPFTTKNNWYIFIQSDRTRSYNFYGNYFIEEGNSNDMLLGTTEENILPRSYNTHGWPIIIDNAPQTHTETRNKMYLQLVTDNNPDTVLYGQIGQIDNAQKNNFCTNINLLNSTVNTKSIIISIPCYNQNNSKFNIACINLSVFHGREYEYLDLQNELKKIKYLDEKFNGINNLSSLKNTNESEYSIISYKKNNLYPKTNLNIQSISAFQTLKILDTIKIEGSNESKIKRITYLTETIDILNYPLSIQGKMSNPKITNTTQTDSLSNKYEYENPSFALRPFYIGTKTIMGIFINAAGTIPNFYCLGLTELENLNLINLMQTNGITNGVITLIKGSNENNYISAEKIVYRIFKLGLIGENSSGSLKLIEANPDILIYSIDEQMFFSEEYSKFLTLESQIFKYTILKTI